MKFFKNKWTFVNTQSDANIPVHSQVELVNEQKKSNFYETIITKCNLGISENICIQLSSYHLWNFPSQVAFGKESLQRFNFCSDWQYQNSLQIEFPKFINIGIFWSRTKFANYLIFLICVRRYEIIDILNSYSLSKSAKLGKADKRIGVARLEIPEFLPPGKDADKESIIV